MHGRAESWISALGRGDRLATCAITELGFVRVAPQAGLAPDLGRAVTLLTAIKKSRRPGWTFLADRVGADALPPWVNAPLQTTDGHLMALANSHGAKLATFDESIPGAFPIP
jgi:predicted nucleic acid-binding protein